MSEKNKKSIKAQKRQGISPFSDGIKNVPPGSKIVITDAGAMRFWSREDQEIVDFLGLFCHRCLGRLAEELLNELGPDYVVFIQQRLGDFFEYEELHRFFSKRTTIQAEHELVAVKVLNIHAWPPE